MTKLAAAIAAAFLGLNGYVYYFLNTEEDLPPRRHFVEFPRTLGDWRCAGFEDMGEKIEKRLGVTDYLLCTYLRRDPAGANSVYVGYHQRQVREGAKSFAESSIHPPRHCLPGSGWQIIESDVVHLEIPGLPEGGADVNRLIIAKGNMRQLVYYWYHSRGRVIAEDYQKILYMVWDRATRGRTDGSLVRFTIPIQRDGVEHADAQFRELAGLLLPRLSDYVPE